MPHPALKISGLSKTFQDAPNLFGGPRRQVHAVRSVDLEVTHGETLGIVGGQLWENRGRYITVSPQRRGASRLTASSAGQSTRSFGKAFSMSFKIRPTA